MLDAHCHLDFDAFDADREEHLAQARAAGLRGLLIAGYDARRRPLARHLAQSTPGIWAAAGLHPWAVAALEPGELDLELQRLADDLAQGGFSAMGELGMDFLRATTAEERQQQESALVRQLGMARELDLPIVIHAVKCHASLLAILRCERLPKAGGMMHGYSGSASQVAHFLMLNLDISIGTGITRPEPRKLEDVLRHTPLDRLLVETDAPDRPPHGLDVAKNSPALLGHVVDAVARVLGRAPSEVARISEANARRRFRLGHALL